MSWISNDELEFTHGDRKESHSRLKDRSSRKDRLKYEDRLQLSLEEFFSTFKSKVRKNKLAKEMEGAARKVRRKPEKSNILFSMKKLFQEGRSVQQYRRESGDAAK